MTNQRFTRRVALFITILSVILLGQVAFQERMLTATGATQEEAFEAITQAFEVVEKASREGLEVQTFVEELNVALTQYSHGNYSEAYATAQAVEEEVTLLLNKFRWDKLYPYLIAILNLSVILVVVFVWGRKIWGWFVRQREEEYLSLEIVYEEEEEEKEKTTDKGK